MADITGYSQLGLVGFTDKGDYTAGNTYMMNDLVHYQNSVWRCKADQTSGVKPGENNNWTIFVNGTNDLNAIIAADVQGLLGEVGAQGVNAQILVNAIAEKVATKVLLKTDLVSQIVNDATKAASMAALYAVNAKIGDVANLPNSAADVVAAIVQQNSNFVSGSYIGNGDPTKRSIDTGGTRIGYIIWSSQGTAIVFYSGAYCKYSTNISAIDGASVGSGAGGFWFKTDSRFLNADGVTYNYQSI